MPVAISNTSPLFYLTQADALPLLRELFDAVWVPDAVRLELEAGRRLGHSIPNFAEHPCLKIVNPSHIPARWLATDFGSGELSTMALALEYPSHVVLLDDALARRTAQAAGISVWGTLRVLLEAKDRHLIEQIAPYVDALVAAGMWISDELRLRVLQLAGEKSTR
jgi:predicted nucleic acid-binding protein